MNKKPDWELRILLGGFVVVALSIAALVAYIIIAGK